MSNEKPETSTYKLSILIPTIVGREFYLDRLIAMLNNQIGERKDVEILVEKDNRERRTGSKRNDLIDKAQGVYTVFFDDDDIPGENYIRSILEAIEHNPDVIPINGFMTTNGDMGSKISWEMGLGFEYGRNFKNGFQYYVRFPNHIAPMKRALIKDIRFLDITIGEDYEWAKRINDAGILKTEYRITEQIYHYNFYHK